MSACVFPVIYKVIVCSLLGITALLSPLLNSLICVTIFKNKKLRTTGNILICNLALSDGLIGLALAPLESVYVSYFPTWPIGSVGTDVLNAMWLFSLVSPFVIVSVITIERCRTIRSFEIAKEGISVRKLVSIIIAMWLYSFASVAFMVGNFTNASSSFYEWNVKPTFYYPFLILHTVVPFCTVCIAYYKIFKFAGISHGSELDCSTTSRTFMQNRELRLAKTLAVVIGLLFLVWLPVVIIECFYATESTSCVTEAAGPISVWLTVFSGVMNPIVYFYRNPNLRKALCQLLTPRIRQSTSQMTAALLADT